MPGIHVDCSHSESAYRVVSKDVLAQHEVAARDSDSETACEAGTYRPPVTIETFSYLLNAACKIRSI